MPALADSANSRAVVPDGPVTVVMDLGHRKHSVCVVDSTGQVVLRAPPFGESWNRMVALPLNLRDTTDQIMARRP